MGWSQKLKNTAIHLMKKKQTSREMMFKIPANNPPDFWKILRHRYGITVIKEKVKDKSHYLFWIPKFEHEKVKKWLASATNTSKPLPNTNKKPNRINKSIEGKNDKHS